MVQILPESYGLLIAVTIQALALQGYLGAGSKPVFAGNNCAASEIGRT